MTTDLALAIEHELRARGEFYQPHNKQQQFHAAGAKHRQRLFIAGNRVGKSFGGAQETAFHAMGQYPDWWQGHRFTHPVNTIVGSPSYELLKKSSQALLFGDRDTGALGMIPPSHILKATTRHGVRDLYERVVVRNAFGGASVIDLKSYEQGRSQFYAVHADNIWSDEEVPVDIFTEMLMRLAKTGDRGRGIFYATMTPLLGMTPFVQLFWDEAQRGDRWMIQAGWEDNTYMPAEERAELERNTPPHELEARRNGIPSFGAGMVYPVAESTFVIEPHKIPSHWPCWYAMDFGWTNPTAAVFFAHDRDNDIIYATGEYAQAQLTPQKHAANLHPMGANWQRGVCDPAGAQSSQRDGESLIAVYQRAGLRLSAADNSREAGIMQVLERLQSGRLKIFSSCTGLINERRGYVRDEKTGQPAKGNDHRLDALRYGIVSGIAAARTRQEAQGGGDNASNTGAIVSAWAV